MLLLPIERVSLRMELIEGPAGDQGLGKGRWGSEKERECKALNPNIWDAAVSSWGAKLCLEPRWMLLSL